MLQGEKINTIYKGFGWGTGDVKMSDLISRSQLLKDMACDDALVGDVNMDFIIDNIKNAPVAYDVDKVLKQLEDEREFSNADFERYVDEVSPCLDSEYDDFFHKGIEKAITIIIKAGGKE